MPFDERRLRWDKRYREAPVTVPGEAGVLRENAFLLPRSGQALDLACGRGGNALFLAEKGLTVTAWDFSEVAIGKLNEAARSRALSIRAEVRDVTVAPPEPETFDVICVSYFLARALAPALTAALRPGGLLLYETFVREAISDRGPRNPEYRLAPNELLRLFSDLRVLDYREHGRVGDPSLGRRDIATLVAQKPEVKDSPGEGE